MTNEQIGDYWANMSESSQGEPIIESVHIDSAIRLLKRELRFDENHGALIIEMFRAGAKEYIKGCMENDGENHDIEEEIQRRNRELIADTARPF